MAWIQITDATDVKKLINLDFYKAVETFNAGTQTKFFHSSDVANDVVANINYDTVAAQVLLFTAGVDASGTPL